jgi:hypothetical protein
MAKLPFRPKAPLKPLEQRLNVSLSTRAIINIIALASVPFPSRQGVIMIHRRAIAFQDIARTNYYWNEIKIRMQVLLSGALLVALGLTLFYL